MGLIINKINYRINIDEVKLYFSFDNDIGIKRDRNLFLNNFEGAHPSLSDKKLKELVNSKTKKEIYFSFIDNGRDSHIVINLNENKYFINLFVSNYLKKHFIQKHIIGRSIEGDFSVFIDKKSTEIKGWDTFKVFNLLVAHNTILIALASRATYISKESVEELSYQMEILTKVLFNNEIKHKKDLKENEITCSKIVANQEIKKLLNISSYTGKFLYKNYFQEIKNFYKDELLHDKTLGESSVLTFYEGGFNEVRSEDIVHVDRRKSVMLFKNDTQNVNATNGLKYNGPYKKLKSEKEKDLSFIFIYKNSEDANTLYKYLKNGLKHFTGLESYVGIPIRPNTELSFKYESLTDFEKEFNIYVSNILTEEYYTNLFAYYVSPFKKDEVEGGESNLYFIVKEKLLRKGIASQVIASKNIHSNSFHFSLPNIAIATLAKLGGIPWKLARNDYEELVIGFGSIKVGENRFVGNTIFFNNSGEIKKI